jgi:diguanylate cyclase (GGDEF)-like protein
VQDEITQIARHTAPRGARLAGVVADLAQPVMVVGSSMPVGELEVIFRQRDVSCVAVQEDGGDRWGIIMRAALASALTGRLGYGRAMLERRPTETVTDWAPLVVEPGAPVSDVATRAMARSGDRRYDDVLVRGHHWASASAADLMRSLVGALADRSMRDPHTGLQTRRAALDALAHRCSLVRGGRTRIVLVLLDVQGMAAINARHGQGIGDAVLAELALRLMAGLPRGCEAGRVDGDAFAVLATMPAMDDIQAAASADALRHQLLASLERPSGPVDPAAWPSLHSSIVWSVPGAADPDELVREAEARLAMARGAAARASARAPA